MDFSITGDMLSGIGCSMTITLTWKDSTPEEGKALASILPEPSEVMEWLLFREPKSDKSNTSSTAGPLPTDFGTNEKDGIPSNDTHYNMGLNEVRNLSVTDAKQLLYWAQASNDESEASANAVYLGYDVVPPLEEI